MIVLDLKWSGFIGLFTLGIVLGILWFSRRDHSIDVGSEKSILPLLDQAPLGFLLLHEKTILFANRYVRQLLHLTPEMKRLPDADWGQLLETDRSEIRKDADAAEGRFRSLTFASGRTARWWVFAWDERDAVFVLDVTMQQRMAQATRALVNDLGHELRTPVATILTHLEILGLDDIDEDVQAQSVQLARQEAQRMARLVEDMLELGRLETKDSMARRPVDLLKLVNEIVIQLHPRVIKEAMRLDLQGEPGLPLVLGNADRLRQVFANLLDNALKYGESPITITVELSDQRVRCQICDEGPGIAPEHLPLVSRRFYRAAPEEISGSGLGLALVEEILRRHQSELHITSPAHKGRGTCVWFTLPLANGS
jgi:two-component system phosphate regulon sensor histidine kinase PhoR